MHDDVSTLKHAHIVTNIVDCRVHFVHNLDYLHKATHLPTVLITLTLFRVSFYNTWINIFSISGQSSLSPNWSVSTSNSSWLYPKFLPNSYLENLETVVFQIQWPLSEQLPIWSLYLSFYCQIIDSFIA